MHKIKFILMNLKYNNNILFKKKLREQENIKIYDSFSPPLLLLLLSILLLSKILYH
jgi:hypothetical protein